MKMEVWSNLWCLVLLSCLTSLSACEDSYKYCSKDKCEHRAIGNKCQKTCGGCHNATIQTECPDRKWGSSCMKNCSVGCLDRCDKNSSTCDCKPCYEGLNCSDVSDRCNCSPNGICECKAGWFGTKCTQACPHSCLNEICNSNGSCTQGCTTGWHGVQCDKCSEHCVNNLCSLPGTCMGGCDAGWFGESCGKPCPDNCNSETCDKNNGSCTLCHSGYAGPHCNTSCPENCKGKICNKTDGTCPSGCESCTRKDGRCSTSGTSELVVWVVPVIIITLLLIVIALLVARLKKTERFKRGNYTNQMHGFHQGSPEGTLSPHGNEVQLLSTRLNQTRREQHTSPLLYPNTHRDLTSPQPVPSRDPPHLVRPSPAPIYSEPDLGDEEPESYIVVKHLFE